MSPIGFELEQARDGPRVSATVAATHPSFRILASEERKGLCSFLEDAAPRCQEIVIALRRG
jgi:hypothetical protein